MLPRRLSASSEQCRFDVRFSVSDLAGSAVIACFVPLHHTTDLRQHTHVLRRNGKPTSLGCFDHEEEASRAYDKMMLWCELHHSTGVKGGITNFDPAEYEADIPWLQSITQVSVSILLSLRCCLQQTDLHLALAVQQSTHMW